MNKALTDAFAKVPRRNFLPDDVQEQADYDSALPIGFGQTNSQPSTVMMMLDWLSPEPGDKILDVGSGSGWTTALLAQLTGEKGQVYAVEKIPELVAFGRDNCQRLSIANVRFFQANNEIGLPKHAPYDRILVSASANALPEKLLTQLKPEGKMVIPVGSDILEITKSSDSFYESKTHPGFVFVPLVA